ncbi:MAG: S8 family serine peptidase [Bacteroides sp.]|nr:S8 family serine peptidase [Bacteroides sp.]
MKRLLLLLWVILLATGVSAKKPSWKYRISLTDKAVTSYSLEQPEAFLSPKAIERRVKQGLPIDSTDLPVCQQYIDEICRFGVKVVAIGKWDNFVTVSCPDTTCIISISQLPFVRATECVWTGGEIETSKREKIIDMEEETSPQKYGAATTQIEINNGHLLHEAGFSGQGMTIAVIDAGFHNADRIESMRNIQVLGSRDFVNPASDIYAEHSHGLSVFSCMAMNQPGIMVGTAPDAAYWLLRSEDNNSEQLVEQDYWAAAVEFADSVGMDVINTSLGYNVFDDTSKNYTYCQLDGSYSLMSRQASRIADKGMILVCSAGNTGSGSWKKITVPADAEHVLTVGAINKDRELAKFSSIGNTADGRIKPDVVAMGVDAEIMRANGIIEPGDGTSFASPILCGQVACLWQACPTLTAKELISLVRQSADRHDCPDNIYGYGVPDMWKAYKIYQEKNGNTDAL